MTDEKQFSSCDVQNAVQRCARQLFQVLSRRCGFPIDYEEAAHRLALDITAMVEGDIEHQGAPWGELGVFKVIATEPTRVKGIPPPISEDHDDDSAL